MASLKIGSSTYKISQLNNPATRDFLLQEINKNAKSASRKVFNLEWKYLASIVVIGIEFLGDPSQIELLKQYRKKLNPLRARLNKARLRGKQKFVKSITVHDVKLLNESWPRCVPKKSNLM